MILLTLSIYPAKGHYLTYISFTSTRCLYLLGIKTICSFVLLLNSLHISHEPFANDPFKAGRGFLQRFVAAFLTALLPGTAAGMGAGGGKRCCQLRVAIADPEYFKGRGGRGWGGLGSVSPPPHFCIHLVFMRLSAIGRWQSLAISLFSSLHILEKHAYLTLSDER